MRVAAHSWKDGELEAVRRRNIARRRRQVSDCATTATVAGLDEATEEVGHPTAAMRLSAAQAGTDDDARHSVDWAPSEREQSEAQEPWF
jgi:hypothetical protein